MTAELDEDSLLAVVDDALDVETELLEPLVCVDDVTATGVVVIAVDVVVVGDELSDALLVAAGVEADTVEGDSLVPDVVTVDIDTVVIAAEEDPDPDDVVAEV